jgi:hypothetical protein
VGLLADKNITPKKSTGDILGYIDFAQIGLYLHSLSGDDAAAPDALEGVFSLVSGDGVGFEPKQPLVSGLGGNRELEKP